MIEDPTPSSHIFYAFPDENSGDSMGYARVQVNEEVTTVKCSSGGDLACWWDSFTTKSTALASVVDTTGLTVPMLTCAGSNNQDFGPFGGDKRIYELTIKATANLGYIFDHWEVINSSMNLSQFADITTPELTIELCELDTGDSYIDKIGFDLGAQYQAVFRTASAPSTPALTPGGLRVYPSNSRLSFRSRLDPTLNQVGTSLVYLDPTLSNEREVYATTSALLKTGDRLRIGSSNYFVGLAHSNTPNNQIPLATTITAADLLPADGVVFATMSGQLQIVFEQPQAGETNGNFVFFVPAASSSAQASDGIPDAGVFDFGKARITCPTLTSNYSHWTSNAIPAIYSEAVFNGQAYHRFSCHFEGTSTGEPLTFSISGLINPAPLVPDHNQPLPNYQETSFKQVPILANQLDADNNPLVTATSFASFGPSVQVEAQVLPYLSFQVAGYNQGDTTCANPGDNLISDVTTTGLQVPFGTISSANFTEAAQKLTVATNAHYGYVITAIANDQLGLAGADCSLASNQFACINGFGGRSTIASALPWSENDGAGFGYTLSLQNGDTYLNGTTPNVALAFNYAQDGWRSFPDRRHDDTPIQLANNNRSTSEDVINLCYRLKSDSINQAGEYYNYLTYTVTATF